MKAFGLVLMILGTSAFAKNSYDLKMKMFVDGKHVASPRVITKEGEKASIFQKSKDHQTFVEVIPSEGTWGDHKGTLLEMSVGYINKDGSRTLKSHPKILVDDSGKAHITVGADAANGTYSQMDLDVTVTKRAL
jgi:hypothetical protein